MAIWLISDNKIVGTSDPASANNLPSGFSAVEGIEGDPQDVYWDGFVVQLKPPRPSPNHFWVEDKNAWEVYEESQIERLNWMELEAKLPQTGFYLKLWAAAGECLRCSRDLSILMSTISSAIGRMDAISILDPEQNTLYKALISVFDSIIQDIEKLGLESVTLTEEDKLEVISLLEDCRFSLVKI